MKQNTPLVIFTALAALALGGVIYLWQSQNAQSPQQALPQTTSQSQLAVKPPTPPAPIDTGLKAELLGFDTVRLETDGSLLVAGHALPSTEVTVLANGNAVGKTVTNTEGAFVLTPDKPLSPGAVMLVLEMQREGTTSRSEQTVAIDIKPQSQSKPLIAILQPAAPTLVLQTPSTAADDYKGVIIHSLDYDKKGNIIFGGRAPKGSTVLIYIDNTYQGTVKVDEKGLWHIPGPSSLSISNHTVRADEVDEKGVVKSRFEIPFFRTDPAVIVKMHEPPVPEFHKPLPAIVTAQASDSSAVVTAKPFVDTKPAKPPAQTTQSPEDTGKKAVAVIVTETSPAITYTAKKKSPETEQPQTETTVKTQSSAAPTAIEPAPRPDNQPTLPSEAETEPSASANASESSSPVTSEAPAIPSENNSNPLQQAPAMGAETGTGTGAETPPPQTAEAKSIEHIIIQPGNNLWALSRKIYGQGNKYTVIYEANKANIKNPQLIYPGQVFIMPKTR